MEAETCRQVIEACFPALQVFSIAYLAEGWDSTVWEVNSRYVFRFPKRTEIAPGLLKEIRLLPVLTPHVPLRVPHFEYVWEGGPQYSGVFVGYRKIAGQPLTNDQVVSAGPELAQELGAFLTALHHVPLSEAAALGLSGSTGQWRQERRAFYVQVRNRVFPLLSGADQHRISAIWERFLDNNDHFRFEPVLIHADLNCEHILFDAQQQCITGIIDWEDAAIGDPAMDFAGLLDCGLTWTQSVMAAYAGRSDASILTRAQFYRAIGPAYQILYGLDIGAPEHISQGLDQLRTTWS